jgi:hypothetical protein
MKPEQGRRELLWICLIVYGTSLRNVKVFSTFSLDTSTGVLCSLPAYRQLSMFSMARFYLDARVSPIQFSVNQVKLAPSFHVSCSLLYTVLSLSHHVIHRKLIVYYLVLLIRPWQMEKQGNYEKVEEYQSITSF